MSETVSLRLSKHHRVLIAERDRACVVCGRDGLIERLVVYQHRPGNDPRHGVRLCEPCRAAIDRREVGISGLAPDQLSITDGRHLEVPDVTE